MVKQLGVVDRLHHGGVQMQVEEAAACGGAALVVGPKASPQQILKQPSGAP
jgi:hypothetical protein